MEPIHMIAGILATQAQRDLAHSALPDAPVVPAARAKPRRIRSRTAALLYRVADAVSPSVDTAAARPTLAGREGRTLRWDESRCRPSPTTSA